MVVAAIRGEERTTKNENDRAERNTGETKGKEEVKNKESKERIKRNTNTRGRYSGMQ
jgi:hypothetical protein